MEKLIRGAFFSRVPGIWSKHGFLSWLKMKSHCGLPGIGKGSLYGK